MNILLKNAQILDPNSSWNLEKQDILITDGQISQIGKLDRDPSYIELESDNLCVSPGFIDLKADFCDPGMEHKETIVSGLDAASAGGFTQVFVQPSTNPVCDNKSVVSYIQGQGANCTTKIGVNGALSKNLFGQELAEMYELYQQGVRLFTDDYNSVNAGLVQRALLYSKDFGGRIVLLSRNPSLSQKAQVNEGVASIRTGLKADPHLSEIIEIERNIRLLSYTGGKMHLSGLSTAEGLQLVRKAKQSGLDLTADVHLMNLIFSEDDILGFDTHLKVLPVLRTKKDQSALWEAVIDGTIDAIVSDHRPTDPEEKELEFDLASFGSPQLETVFPALLTARPEALNDFLPRLHSGPRSVVDLAPIKIEIGEIAELTLFDPTLPYEPNMRREQGRFSPFKNLSLNGKILGVIRGPHASLSNQ